MQALLGSGCGSRGNRLLIRHARWTGGNMELSVYGAEQRSPGEFSEVTAGATCQVYSHHLLGAEFIGPLGPLVLAA